MADQFTPLPVKGLKTNNSTAPTNDQVPVIAAVATTAAPSYTEGNEVKLSTTLGGSLRVSITDAQVEVTNDAGSPLPISRSTTVNSATNGIFTQITNGTTANATTAPLFAQLTNGTANNSTTAPIFATISNGTANNSTTAPLFAQLTNGTTNLASGSGTAAGSLRVAHATDVTVTVSPNQEANALTNPFFTRLTDGTNPIGTTANPLFVQSDFSVGAPKSTSVQSTNTAAGASTTLNGASITAGKTGQLAKVTVTASVRYKAVIESFNGTTATTLAVLFGEGYSTQEFEPVDNTLFQQAGGTGNVFRVTMTNGDNVFAADLYATLQWFEV